MAVYASQVGGKGPFAQSAPQIMQTRAAPPGTFLPGTKVQVGTHRVVIERYLSEGGFAVVYVVQLPHPVEGNDKAVLKRVAVPDKEHLAAMRIEVETMKRLRGQKYIVKYFDSHASQLKGGGFEVFLLMEFCNGGGLIDFMNTRLQNRLTEPEIIHIFTDIAEGVAAMHYLQPPLLHRDLKIENVLISLTRSSRIYKLCDFGSAAPARPAATTAAEGRLIEEDIQKNTTLQYRSPEMIDVYRKQPIDEKSDIWALGVFLYKLCYYTTPFEEVGQMAVLNARFKYPAHPRFSDQLKLLIATMLREQPSERPTIYQILEKACKMDKRDFTLKDQYSRRSLSEGRKSDKLPRRSNDFQAGAVVSPPPTEATPSIPDITPMRRGRPDKPTSHHASAKPSPSPLRVIDGSDPFTALDGNKPGKGDDFSTRFPSLDQFSLLTDPRKKFAFDANQDRQETTQKDLANRVTAALADDAFVRSPNALGPSVGLTEPPLTTSQSVPEGIDHIDSPPIDRKGPPSVPQKSATITVPTVKSPPTSSTGKVPESKVRAIASSELLKTRSLSPGKPPKPQTIGSTGKSASRLASLLQEDASRSQAGSGSDTRSADVSRSSLDGGRPVILPTQGSVNRSQSLNMRQRPVSVNLGKGPTHIKDREIRASDYESDGLLTAPESKDTVRRGSDARTSDMDFLRAQEGEGHGRRRGHSPHSHSHGHGPHIHAPHLHGSHHHHLHHRHHQNQQQEQQETQEQTDYVGGAGRQSKRQSLPAIAASGTRSILSGRFGDTFKVFEGSSESAKGRERTPSPPRERQSALSPAASTETADASADRYERDTLSPASKRDVEKRDLEAEERRVETAALEYRQRLAAKGGTGAAAGAERAASIQNRVQSLLQENKKPVTKTAAGYGRYTETSETPAAHQEDSMIPTAKVQTQPPVPPKDFSMPPKSMSAPVAATQLPVPDGRGLRPQAPPKPSGLRNAQADQPQISPGFEMSGAIAASPLSPGENWEEKFNQKYPSLAGFEAEDANVEAQPKPIEKSKEI